MDPRSWVTLLYVLGAALPAMGIGLALASLGRPVLRRRKYRNLTANYDREKTAAAGDADKLATLEKTYLAAINKSYGKGRRLAEYGGIMRLFTIEGVVGV